MWDPNTPWEQRDELESKRVELVGLAAEVATVARRVGEDLAALDATSPVTDLRTQCEQLHAAAMQVLSPSSQLATSLQGLDDALAAYRDHQRACVQLRQSADTLVGGVTILL
jgi:hypothetical protein